MVEFGSCVEVVADVLSFPVVRSVIVSDVRFDNVLE